jgi:hypothetical protein
LCLATAAAHAQPTPAQPTSADRALGETLFREGRTLLGADRIAEACAKFAESQRLDPQIGTELNLALCHEREGKTASAWAEFVEVAEKAALADRQRAEYAHGHARDLEKKLSRIRVSVLAPAPDLTVKIDGRTIGASAWATAFPIDPGDHTIEAASAARKPYSRAFRVEPGPSTADVQVPALEEATAAPSAPAPAPEPREAPALPTTAEMHRDGSGRKTALAIALAAVGVAGVGLGSYFGLQTLSKNATANDHCPGDRCDQAGVDAGRDASTAATISTIAFAVGVAGIASGAYFFFLAPQVGASGGGLQVAARW